MCSFADYTWTHYVCAVLPIAHRFTMRSFADCAYNSLYVQFCRLYMHSLCATLPGAHIFIHCVQSCRLYARHWCTISPIVCASFLCDLADHARCGLSVVLPTTRPTSYVQPRRLCYRHSLCNLAGCNILLTTIYMQSYRSRARQQYATLPVAIPRMPNAHGLADCAPDC